MKTLLSFAMYKPKEGKAEELKVLVKDHIPTLRKYELITDNTCYMLESKDGTIIEVFEWAGEEGKNKAHEHPAIATVWEKMGALCEFPAMKDLPEGEKRFPNFDIISSN